MPVQVNSANKIPRPIRYLSILSLGVKNPKFFLKKNQKTESLRPKNRNWIPEKTEILWNFLNTKANIKSIKFGQFKPVVTFCSFCCFFFFVFVFFCYFIQANSRLWNDKYFYWKKPEKSPKLPKTPLTRYPSILRLKARYLIGGIYL